MARRMKITRPRPQGRAVDVDGKMIRSGEIGVFDEATISARRSWFEPAPLPKPKKTETKPKSSTKKSSTKKTKTETKS